MITRLTDGPENHFFGYYGICPWDAGGINHLALQTDFDARVPEADDIARVGLVNAENRSFRPMAETRAFNLQQGSMMHWINAGYGEEFTFNDWEDDRVVSRAVNPETGAQRTINSAIAAVSPKGFQALGLNFGRMAACRTVVGYANEIYRTDDLEPAPEDDGLFSIDLEQGTSKLLVSLAAIQKKLPCPDSDDQPHWFNHAVFSPDGSRILFFARIMHPGCFLDSIWIVKKDGTGLKCLIEYGTRVSHFAWYDNEHVMISCNALGEMQFTALNISSGRIAAMPIEAFPKDGHNAFSPDFKWIVCDTPPQGPNRERKLLLHSRLTAKTHLLGAFPHPEHIQGVWRCDPHPRWSADGKRITFDSVHEGSRQVYQADVSGIVEAVPVK